MTGYGSGRCAGCGDKLKQREMGFEWVCPGCHRFSGQCECPKGYDARLLDALETIARRLGATPDPDVTPEETL